MNRVAERQVKTSNALRIENNRLSAVDRVARAALTKAIDETMSMRPRGWTAVLRLLFLRWNKRVLLPPFLPLTRGERRNMSGAFAATAAIFVQDPFVVPPFSGEAFAKLYGLTPSELRVLLAMAPGLGVKKKMPRCWGVSETTAKTHLQHIYGKTGTSKQTELSTPVHELYAAGQGSVGTAANTQKRQIVWGSA